MNFREEIDEVIAEAQLQPSSCRGDKETDDYLVNKILKIFEKRIDTLIQCEAKRLNGLGLVEKTRDRYNDVNLSDEVIAKLNKLKEMLKE